MYKKVITACMAVAALAAFALPASASAATSPVLTTFGGAVVPAGTKVRATNVGNTVFTGGINVTCSKDLLTGTITKNEGLGGAIEGTIETANFESSTSVDCSSAVGPVRVTTNVGNGTPWCVKALPGVAMELQVRGGGCAEKARSITFVLDITNLGIQCKFERTTTTGPVKGTYNTDPEDAQGKIEPNANSEFKAEEPRPFGCPASGALEMTFTLEEDNETSAPFTIS